MVRLVNLKSSFDTLNEPEQDAKSQDECSYPKRVPLHPVSAVMPPLREVVRCCLVISLFEDH